MTESTKGIRMLLLLAFACILFCFVCCITSISVSEKSDKEKSKKPQKFSNSVGPVTLDLAVDPYHPMTEGDVSNRSEKYVAPPKA